MYLTVNPLWNPDFDFLSWYMEYISFITACIRMKGRQCFHRCLSFLASIHREGILYRPNHKGGFIQGHIPLYTEPTVQGSWIQWPPCRETPTSPHQNHHTEALHTELPSYRTNHTMGSTQEIPICTYPIQGQPVHTDPTVHEGFIQGNLPPSPKCIVGNVHLEDG